MVGGNEKGGLYNVHVRTTRSERVGEGIFDFAALIYYISFLPLC